MLVLFRNGKEIEMSVEEYFRIPAELVKEAWL